MRDGSFWHMGLVINVCSYALEDWAVESQPEEWFGRPALPLHFVLASEPNEIELTRFRWTSDILELVDTE